jgi:uncharacterized membrane protein (DUF106 family)
MSKVIDAVKAFFAFLKRYGKYLAVIAFGVVTAVVVSWLGSKSTLSEKDKATLKGMPERLKRYREAYEKSLNDAMKPKGKDEIISDFDSNFGGKP